LHRSNFFAATHINTSVQGENSRPGEHFSGLLFLDSPKIAGFGQGLQPSDEIANHFRSGKLVPFGETISFISFVYFTDGMLHLAHNYTPVV